MKIALNPNINGDLVEVIRQRNRKNLDLTRVSEDNYFYMYMTLTKARNNLLPS